MADFKSTLQKYLKAEIALSEVERVLIDTLQQQPKYATVITQGLKKLAEKGGLSASDAQQLLDVIDQLPAVQSHPSTASDEDKTRIGISRIDNDSTRLSNQDDDKTRVAPSEPPVAQDDDRTKITSLTSSNTQATSSSAFNTYTGSTTGWSKPFAEGDDQHITIGSVLKDRFRLIEFIGAGGMGDVYIAEDSILIEADDIETTVAIKVLNKEFRDHPESFRAMQREARKTMDLAHPNIVNVFSFERDRANAFMVMELMRGDPLDKAIKSHPYGFTTKEVEHYVSGMGEALKYAHHKGVIHCDFKPSNIFIDQDTIKVFDFGIARAASNGPLKHKNDSFDAGDLGAYTENYASIELIERDADADPKDDIYALGCITYELLTGKHPFLINGKKTSSKKALAKNLKPARIKKINRRQWQALQGALALKKEHRIPSVELFLNGFLQKNHATGFFSQWFAWPLIGIVSASAAYLPVTNWLTQNAIDEFSLKLQTLPNEDIALEITRFEMLDDSLKEKYLGNQKVKNALLSYFKKSIQENASNHQYLETARLQAQAQDIFENSAESDIISLTIIEVEKERKIQLNQLNDQLNSILALPLNQLLGSIKSVEQWRNTLNKLEPDSDKLQDQRLQIKFQDAISEYSGQQQFKTAKVLLDKASHYFGKTLDLKNLAYTLQQQQRSFEQQQQQQTLVTILSELLTDDFNLASLTSAEQDIVALRALNSAHPLLVELDALTKALLQGHLDELLQSQQWDQALSNIRQYQWALNKYSKRQLEQQIYAAKEGQNSKVEQLVAAIDAAIQARRLTGEDSTQLLFSQLEQQTEDANILQEAQQGITQAWLKSILQARANQDWDSANDLIIQAKKSLAVSEHPLLDRQQQSVAQAKNLFEQQQAAAQALLAEQQKAQTQAKLIAAKALALQAQTQTEITELSTEFAAIVADQNLSISASRKALRLIEQIKALDNKNTLITTGKSQLLDRYLSDAKTHFDAQRVQSALQLSREGLRIFPNDAQLIAQIAQTSLVIEQQQAEQEQRLLTKQAELDNNIDKLLIDIDDAAQAATFEGANSTQILFAELQSLSQTPTVLQEAQEAITQGWLSAIFKARSAQQWQQGEDLLNAAKIALPQSAQESLQIEQGKLAEAKQRFAERADAEQQLLAEQQKAAQIQAQLAAQKQQLTTEIDALKQQFDNYLSNSELSITNTRRALNILDQLAALDRDNQAIEQGQQQLIDSYLSRSTQHRQGAELVQALKLMEDGLRIFPQSEQLQSQRDSLQTQLYQENLDRQESEVNQLLISVEQLIDNSLEQANSVAAIDQVLDNIESAGGSELQLKGVKSQAAIGYLNLSKQYTGENRFAEAQNALTSAKRFDPTLASISLQQAAIERGQTAHAKQQLNRKQQAIVNGVKQSFDTQISANDIRKAIISFKQLQKILAPDDAFIVEQGPAAIVGAYVRLTDQMVKRDRYTNAIKLLQGARKYALDPNSIDDKQKSYELARNIYLINAATTNIKTTELRKTKQLLNSIKPELETARWNKLDAALQNAIALRIAQWQSRRPNSAKQLLTLALELFPNSTKIRTLSATKSTADTGEENLVPEPETTPDTPIKEPVTVFDALESKITQSAKSTAKLLKAKQDLNRIRSKLSKEQYTRLDNNIIAKISPLLENAVSGNSKNAQLWLNKSKAYWPRAKPIQQISIAAKKPVKVAVSTSGGIACTASLAGRGSKRSSVCYDSVNGTKTPYMIVVPSGGSGPFAISKFEIAKQDYNLFCKTSGACGGLSGNVKKPAVGISIGRMKQYAAWLTTTTGHNYRLPSSSQWLHAAKATGARQPKNFNCRLKQGSKILKGKSLKDVFSGTGNSWGLVNYLGNAQEVVRAGGGYAALGGNYTVSMSKCSVNLKSSAPNGGNKQTGFRVVRSL